ncbi:MAG: hypothetical protein IJI22_04285 [Bacilli bacterium]|nr:hypothetical protein [Bacilli bacterium]
MNVLISNKQQNTLSELDIDIIKSLTGSYQATEIVEMFKNFFFSKMILDVSALNNNEDIKSYEVLAKGLDPDKIIFLLPEGSKLCTPNFLSHLIGMGIYNFTTNVNGVKYLLKKPNTLNDVEHIKKMANIKNSTETGAAVATIAPTSNVAKGPTIIGVRNVTEHAGATTLIYMLKKELAFSFGFDNVVAVEIGKNDFQIFNDKKMFSVRQADIKEFITKAANISILLVDLNDCTDDSFCGDVLYLVEPSTIKLNKLIRRNKIIFTKLQNHKVVLNKSLLLNNDVYDFENEAGIKVFYNMPPLDERKRNAVINDFLTKLGVFNKNSSSSSGQTKIFGLFRR